MATHIISKFMSLNRSHKPAFFRSRRFSFKFRQKAFHPFINFASQSFSFILIQRQSCKPQKLSEHFQKKTAFQLLVNTEWKRRSNPNKSFGFMPTYAANICAIGHKTNYIHKIILLKWQKWSVRAYITAKSFKLAKYLVNLCRAMSL